MKKAIQLAKQFWLRLAVLFAAVVRVGRACVTKACAVAHIKGEGKSCEITRAAVAGMILFGIAGAGMGASGGISAYGVAKTGAGATVAVGWGPYWLLWTVVWSLAGAGVGAAAALLAPYVLGGRGPRVALMIVGALGGIFAGGTWGSAVARERVVEVRAQPSNAAPLQFGDGAKLSVVNGPVRLTGTVARDLNGLLLAFMLGSGALVGVLAARGLSTPKGEEVPLARPYPPQGNYTA
jgi:hypothetical protein